MLPEVAVEEALGLQVRLVHCLIDGTRVGVDVALRKLALVAGEQDVGEALSQDPRGQGADRHLGEDERYDGAEQERQHRGSQIAQPPPRQP